MTTSLTSAGLSSRFVRVVRSAAYLVLTVPLPQDSMAFDKLHEGIKKVRCWVLCVGERELMRCAVRRGCRHPQGAPPRQALVNIESVGSLVCAQYENVVPTERGRRSEGLEESDATTRGTNVAAVQAHPLKHYSIIFASFSHNFLLSSGFSCVHFGGPTLFKLELENSSPNPLLFLFAARYTGISAYVSGKLPIVRARRGPKVRARRGIGHMKPWFAAAEVWTKPGKTWCVVRFGNASANCCTDVSGSKEDRGRKGRTATTPSMMAESFAPLARRPNLPFSFA